MNDAHQLKIGMVNRPFPGQEGSGDLPFFYYKGDDLLVGLIDSLGHGPAAHASSNRIKAFLDAHWHSDLPRLLDALNNAVTGDLGAAIGIAHVSLGSGEIRWAGVGNVLGNIVGSSNLRLVSRDGVLGQHYRTPVVQEAQLETGDKLILVSDGMQERLFTQCSDTELSREPGVLANYLLRHFGKAHDDASCLIFEF